MTTTCHYWLQHFWQGPIYQKIQQWNPDIKLSHFRVWTNALNYSCSVVISKEKIKWEKQMLRIFIVCPLFSCTWLCSKLDDGHHKAGDAVLLPCNHLHEDALQVKLVHIKTRLQQGFNWAGEAEARSPSKGELWVAWEVPGCGWRQRLHRSSRTSAFHGSKDCGDLVRGFLGGD